MPTIADTDRNDGLSVQLIRSGHALEDLGLNSLPTTEEDGLAIWEAYKAVADSHPGQDIYEAQHQGREDSPFYTASREEALAFASLIEGPAIVIPHQGPAWAMAAGYFENREQFAYFITSKEEAKTHVQQECHGYEKVTRRLIAEAFGEED